MGVNSIVSGRKPSMLRIRARTGRETGVAVSSWATTGVTVSLGGWKGVDVTVETVVAVGAGSSVETGGRSSTRGRQEVRQRSEHRNNRMRGSVRRITNL